MRTIDIHEAKANLFRLIEQASQGASFLIAISGTPRVMVTPVDASDARQTKRVGFLQGAV